MASPGLTAPLLPDGAASPATPFPAIPTWTPPTSAERERDRRREEAIDRELAELEAERLRGLFELGRDLDLGGSDGGAGDLVATRADEAGVVGRIARRRSRNLGPRGHLSTIDRRVTTGAVGLNRGARADRRPKAWSAAR